MKNLKLLDLDHYQQTTDYTCGPATLLSFLNYHDKKLTAKLTEKRLAKILKTCPTIGTHPQPLYRLLRETKSNSQFLNNANILDLSKAIDNDLPAIVLWHDDFEWHWSTVIGYDQSNIILLDPYLKDGLNFIQKSKFNNSWSKIAIK